MKLLIEFDPEKDSLQRLQDIVNSLIPKTIEAKVDAVVLPKVKEDSERMFQIVNSPYPDVNPGEVHPLLQDRGDHVVLSVSKQWHIPHSSLTELGTRRYIFDKSAVKETKPV